MRILVPTLAAIALITSPLALAAAEPDPMAQTAVVAITEKERECLVETSHRIAFTIQACDAVRARITDQAALDLLAMIRKESALMQEELAELMRSKAVPTPTLGEDYREDLAAMGEAKAEEVYETYRDYQIDVTDDLVEALEDASEEAKDAEVRAFAVRWLPAAKHHAEVLEAYEPVQ